MVAADHCDVAVLGAGPAGLAAAVAAADAGLGVALIDAGPRPGGQYYRHPPDAFHAARPGGMHHDWDAFAGLRSALGDARPARAGPGYVEYLPRHHVWSAEGGTYLTLRALLGEPPDGERILTARALVIAAGAHDRQLPFPGWDLPGVLTAGGAQALLKGNLVLAGRRPVVAGTGPFLLPVAAGLAEAGADVAGVYEAGLPAAFARRPGAVARNADKLGEAVSYARALARHRVPLRARHAVVAAHGTDALEAVTVARVDSDWRVVGGSERRIECDVLAVGYGFTPQLEIPLALGCGTRRDADGSLVVDVDHAQATSVPGVYAAGETTGVGGAALARTEGELAGLAVARSFDRELPRSAAALSRLLRRRRAGRRFAAALHAAYPVRSGWSTWLADDTPVCRCEEVPYADVRDAVWRLGATDARSVKLLSRPGMGWCQGRICGTAVADLTAQLAGRDVTDIDLAGLAARPLAQPVPLGVLAGTATEGQTNAGDEDPDARVAASMTSDAPDGTEAP